MQRSTRHRGAGIDFRALLTEQASCAPHLEALCTWSQSVDLTTPPGSPRSPRSPRTPRGKARQQLRALLPLHEVVPNVSHASKIPMGRVFFGIAESQISTAEFHDSIAESHHPITESHNSIADSHHAEGWIPRSRGSSPAPCSSRRGGRWRSCSTRTAAGSSPSPRPSGEAAAAPHCRRGIIHEYRDARRGHTHPHAQNSRA